MNLNVKVDYKRKEGLAELVALVESPAKKTELSMATGLGIRELTRDHLRELSLTRHATAERLGAEPSGHLAQAARAVEGSPVTADATSATLTINHPGLVRALRDVTIRPGGGKQFLTIPIAAAAYNRRAGQFSDLIFLRAGPKQTPILAQKQGEGQPALAMYLLVRSVTQKQDRTLLPSDEALAQCAVDAADAWFQSEIAEIEGGAA